MVSIRSARRSVKNRQKSSSLPRMPIPLPMTSQNRPKTCGSKSARVGGLTVSPGRLVGRYGVTVSDVMKVLEERSHVKGNKKTVGHLDRRFKKRSPMKKVIFDVDGVLLSENGILTYRPWSSGSGITVKNTCIWAMRRLRPNSVMKPLTACAAGFERRRHIVVAEKARCQQQLGYGPAHLVVTLWLLLNGIPHMVPWKPSLRRMPTFKGSADFFRPMNFHRPMTSVKGWLNGAR